MQSTITVQRKYIKDFKEKIMYPSLKGGCRVMISTSQLHLGAGKSRRWSFKIVGSLHPRCFLSYQLPFWKGRKMLPLLFSDSKQIHLWSKLRRAVHLVFSLQSSETHSPLQTCVHSLIFLIHFPVSPGWSCAQQKCVKSGICLVKYREEKTYFFSKSREEVQRVSCHGGNHFSCWQTSPLCPINA